VPLDKPAIDCVTRSELNAIPVFEFGQALSGVFLSNEHPSALPSGARQIYLPSSSEARRKFIKSWARRNAQRIAAGLGGLSLVLPMAMAASAQEQVQVDVSTIDGVVSAAIDENGNLLITFENGEQITIDAAGFRAADGGIFLVPTSTADIIAQAAVDGDTDLASSGLGIGGLGALGALAAAGGGGGDGGTVVVPPEAQVAFVVDGYLSGAQVFGDANNNGIFDDGEASTTTAADGSFDSSLFADTVPLVAVGGIDISTGEVFTGTLKAPAGSTVVTPLTTVVQALIDSDTSGTPPTAAEAAALVASSLGLSGDLLNDDPAALAETGDLSQLQAAAKIAAVVNLVSASAPSDPGGAVDAVLAALAQDLTDGEGGDPFDDPNALNAALVAAGPTIEVSTSDLAEALVGAATQIDEATDLADLESAQTVVQGTLTDAVTQSVGDTDGTSVLSDANDNTALFDNVVPLRPVLDASLADGSFALNAASEASITIFGTGQAGSVVTVVLGDATGSSLVNESGEWSVTLLGEDFPSDGALVTSITAAKDVNGATIVSGEALTTVSYEIDTTPPAPPSGITLDEDLVDGVINDSEVGSGAIRGVADPLATVRLTPAAGSAVETTADNSGNFLFDLTFAFSEGPNTVQITQIDQAGNTSQAAELSFNVDRIAPAGTLDVVEGDGVVDVTEAADGVQFSGTGEDGATVEVSLLPDGGPKTLLGSTTVSNGVWSFTTDTPADGSYEVIVEVTDAAANLTNGSRQFTVDATAPELSNIATDKAALVGADDTTPVTVSGSVSGATSVSVAFLNNSDEVVASTDAVLSGGSFSAALDLSGLGDGSYSLRVIAGDGTNDTTQTTASAITFDRTPPATPSIDVIAGDDIVEGSELAANVVISGTGETGSTVTVKLDDNDVGSDVVVGGVWSIEIAAPAGGNYTVTAIAQDTAGNLSDTSAGRAFEVITTTPSVGIDELAIGSLANAAETAAPVAVTGTSANATEVTVRVVQGQTEIVAPVQATLGDGTWSVSLDISAISDGSYSIEAIASDGVTPVSTSTQIEIDATAPQTPTIDTVAGDGVVNASEISGGKYTLSGDAEDGAEVEITFNGTETVSVTANASGWTYERTASDGTDEIEVTATDTAGNPSGAASASITVDITAPDAPSFDLSDDLYDAGEVGSVTISGTGAEAEATVRLSSALFADDIDVIANGSGVWSTEALDLSVNADGNYQISAVVIDAAGNVSAAATADRTIDAIADPAVQITLAEGEQEGDLVVYDFAELTSLAEEGESDPGLGNVSNVPAGTEVTVRITGTAASGAFDETYGPFLTDANGDFSVIVPDADFLGLDGMTEAGTLTFSAAGQTLTLNLLINSDINEDGSGVSLAGTTAITPLADIGAAVEGETGIELVGGTELSNGLTVVAAKVLSPAADYQALAVYDGVSSAPTNFFAFDGGAASDDLPAFSSKIYIRGDDVFILQIGASITTDPEGVQQTDDPLYTVHRIPAASLLAAFPAAEAAATNLVLDAAGVTNFSFSLSDIDPDYAGGGIPANVGYVPIDISASDGPPVVLLFREDQGTQITSEGYIVQIDLNDGSVTAREIDIAPLLDTSGDGSINDFFISQRLFNDPATGELIRSEFEAPDQGDGLTRTARQDYVNGILSASTTGNDDQSDLLVAEGGIIEFLDGGNNGSGGDNDFLIVGNTVGDETGVNITVDGNFVTVSLDRAVFQSVFGETGTVNDFSFDVFWTGSVNPTDFATGTFSPLINGVTEPQGGATPQGFSVARFTVDLDVTGFAGTSPDAGPFEFVTLEVSGLAPGAFYGFGFNSVEGDADIGVTPPNFDGFLKVGGVDGSDVQFVVVSDSQSTNGLDHVSGFDLSDTGDVIQVQANFDIYRGTGLERVANDATGVSIAGDTGIVVFDGLTDGDDAPVIAMVEAALTGVQGESIIAITGDESAIAVWRLDFDSDGNASTDSFLRLDGLTYEDLSAFGANDIQLFLPEA